VLACALALAEIVQKPDGTKVIRTVTTQQTAGGTKQHVAEEVLDEEALRQQQALAKKMMGTVAKGIGGMVMKAAGNAIKNKVTGMFSSAFDAITGGKKK
jgi:hypothetical protein